MAEHTEGNAAPLIGRLEGLVAIGGVGLLALAVGLVALVNPSTKASTGSVDYRQAGTFSYSASAPRSSVYGLAGLRSGEPIATSIIKTVGVRFAYRLSSGAPLNVHGTQSLVAEVRLNSGLNRQYSLAPRRAFTGPAFTSSGSLPVRQIVAYVNSSSAALAGDVQSGATLTIVPKIAVAGGLGARNFAAAFQPPLLFSLSGTSLTLSQGSQSTSVVHVGASANATLTPSQSGSVKYRSTVPNSMPLLVAHPSVTSTREFALGLAALCLLLGLLVGRPLMRRGSARSDRDRIRALYGSLIVPVGGVDLLGAAVADVTSMAALAELAKRYEAMIMHRRGDDRDDYMVWDNGMLYRHTILAANPSSTDINGVGQSPQPDAPIESETADPVVGESQAPGESIRQLRRGRRRASV